MSFKENFLEKIEIDQLAENVLRSLKQREIGKQIDKASMQRLLGKASYRYEKQRDLDLYIKELDSGPPRVLVLDNELAVYATTIADVVLRKSPTIKEMLKIRNAIKILNDADVIVSKKIDSVAGIQKECADRLDLTLNHSDLEAIAEEGRIAWEINDRKEVRESLLIFRMLLDFKAPPPDIAVEGFEAYGKLGITGKGEILFGPGFIYQDDRMLKFMEEPILIATGRRSEDLLKLAAGKIKAAAEGSPVFQLLKDTAVKRFFGSSGHEKAP